VSDIFSIKNKTIIVTGAGGSGMAGVLAENMAKYHANVYALDIKFSKKGRNKSSKFLNFIECDITEQNKFNDICKMIFSKHKKIDVLVNGAGVTYPENDKKFYSEEKWDITNNVNLKAAFQCSQTVIKYMLKRKNGSIINFTSINAELGFPKNPAYVASKGGLKMLTKALAKDWGKFGIRVNNIGPGYMKTEMTKKSWNDVKLRKARTSRTLLNRWGDKQDIVGPCIFLASDASKYVTGLDLYVDGGWLANGLSE
tara:strand:- start:871 stop:1635 length:765 start_codon:yes stop_codon:yes gene_type:complete